jgi:hypothetical protein
MLAYLKYYFRTDSSGNGLYVDSIACLGNEIPKPDYFVKWYEDGDLADPVYSEEELKYAPLFSLFFAPRKITFDLSQYKLGV